MTAVLIATLGFFTSQSGELKGCGLRRRKMRYATTTSFSSTTAAKSALRHGIRLTTVRENGPSAKAGLAEGDVIQSINGDDIEFADELIETVRGHKVGDKLTYKILREGEPREISVTLAAGTAGRGGRGFGGGGGGGGGRGGRGGAFAGAGTTQPAGAFSGLTGEEAEGGVKITAVTEDGPAAKAGLKEGDLIVSAGEKSIKTFEELQEEIRSRKVGDKSEPLSSKPVTKPRTWSLFVGFAAPPRGAAEEALRAPTADSTAGRLKTSRTTRDPRASSTAGSTNPPTLATLDARQQPQPQADVFQPVPR